MSQESENAALLSGEAEPVFDAEAFTARLNEKIAGKRATMLHQGDEVQAVAVARWIVGCNNPKHEPWLSNMEPLLDEIDKLRAALSLEKQRAAGSRFRLGVSKQDLLDAANSIEAGEGGAREASMFRSLIDSYETAMDELYKDDD